MLPTFVVMLREGVEATLIVGIVAAFLARQRATAALRKMWLGVTVATVLCVGVGVGLHVLSRELPQRQQEMLETVVGAIAIAMVTYMIVFMKRHARDLSGQLRNAAGSALASGSQFALVAMGFLAVLREGFESAVFLTALLNASADQAAGLTGALLGLALAMVIGYGIYRGGVRLNLAKFFRATGVVLVVVAAGLVMTALHTAHEAGWLLFGQTQALDLSGAVRPGSVQASLLTGVLGIQPKPVVIELIGWLAYLVPLLAYLFVPARQRPGTSITKAPVPASA
ncbi:MAG: high-affinity iron transporter [Pseudonocardiales bacterium]|nr:putative iron permease [Frankiales bacterium]MDQ1736856.1 high-affinity iron transporter [Pseudonocardiales bacterium]